MIPNKLEIVVNRQVEFENKFGIKNFILDVLELKQIKKGFVELTIVSKKEIVNLNIKYFNKSNPTDVISFNLDEEVELLHADIYICSEIIIENAKIFSKSFEEELKLVIIHGILHALGYEDTTDEKKAVMEKEQSKLFELLLQQ